MSELVTLNAVGISNLQDAPSGFDEGLQLNVVGSFEMVAMSYDTVGFDRFVYAPGSIPNSYMALLEQHDPRMVVGALRTENATRGGQQVAMGYGAFHDTNSGRDAYIQAQNNARLGIQHASTGLYILNSATGGEIPQRYQEMGAKRLVNETDTFETSLVLRGNIPGAEVLTVNSALPLVEQLDSVRGAIENVVEDWGSQPSFDRVAVEMFANYLSEQSAALVSLLRDDGQPEAANELEQAEASRVPADVARVMAKLTGQSAMFNRQLRGLELCLDR